MWSLCVGLVLAGSPGASAAEAFAKAQQWEELYLAFAAADPKAFSPKDQQRVAKRLAQGCDALLGSDAVMAYSLGEKSVAFHSVPSAVLCAARAAVASEQRTAADELLRQGLTRHPKDGPLSLERARLQLSEGDAEGALRSLSAVTGSSGLVKEAAELRGRARQLVAEQAQGRSRLAGDSAVPLNQGATTPPESSSEPRPVAPLRTNESLGYESGLDEEGRRTRQNAFFRFRFFSAQRDFGQRAEYEGRVQAALDEARVTARSVLGVSRESPVEVILYSKAEFALHHGPWAAAAIAGFYGGSAIRMNDSAEISQQTRGTLVHEYVHAVVDELCRFDARGVPRWLNEGLAEYVQWEFEGRRRPEGRTATALKQLAVQNRLPPLTSMRDDPLIASADPGLLYAYATLAVRSYVERYGMASLVALVKEVGQGASFERAFEARTGTDLARFEEGVRDEIAK